MQYHSLSGHKKIVDFREATILGQAPDKGLYFPKEIPQIAPAVLADLKQIDKVTLSYQIMSPYVGNTIPKEQLTSILAETIDFEIPLHKLSGSLYSLELFHGPTLAFKDVGARFMSRCLGYFNQYNSRKVTVLVATSGDTGGAVANGFVGVEGVEVIILYPSGKVSPVQELQLTTLGNNITALEVKGTFDDCQAIVKNAFLDKELQTQYQLTSANSINVARWLPQQLYYFFAYQQWQKHDAPIISVPSGNYGNLAAGVLAWKSGLPVKKFIAASNENDTIPRYFENGQLNPLPTIATLSNAMDVSLPSNWVRIEALFNQDINALKSQISSIKITDAATVSALKEIYTNYYYIADPHGAVAYEALRKYNESDVNGIFLETAHPVKFPDTVKMAIGHQPEVPKHIASLLDLKKHSIIMENDYEYFKSWMCSRK